MPSCPDIRIDIDYQTLAQHTKTLRRQSFTILLATLLLVLGVATYDAVRFWVPLDAEGSGDGAPETVTLIASLDTPPAHFRNALVRRFASDLQRSTGGAVTLEIYEAGQLMSDRDVGKALAWGTVDFALPADSKVARFEPDANLLSLPIFYGQPAEIAYRVADGELGVRARRAIAATLNVTVLEPPLDLGHSATFSTERPILEARDYAGLKLRIPGGVGPAALFQALGAVPLAVPFPDVPLALSQGNLDAIQSTFETVRSARLWDAGLRHCLEDNANLLQYIPMLSNRAAKRIPSAHRHTLHARWAAHARESRQLAIRTQREARDEIERAGVTCEMVTQSPNSELLQRLRAASRTVARSTGMDMQLVEEAMRTVAPDAF